MATQPVTAADLSTFTKGAVAADDPIAEKAVAGALAAIRTYCGWHVLGVKSEVLVLDGSGAQELQIPTTRVLDVARVWEDDDELPASAFRWSKDGTLRKRVGCWSDEYRSITVELDHGFEAAADLVSVVLAVAARATSNPMGYTTESVGSMSFGHGAVGGGFLEDEYRRLDPYRAVV